MTTILSVRTRLIGLLFVFGLLLTTVANIPAAQAEIRTQSFERRVCAQDLTIRSEPDGRGYVLATLFYWDRFIVDNPRDGVWFFGRGYKNGSNQYVASGYVLAQYLC